MVGNGANASPNQPIQFEAPAQPRLCSSAAPGTLAIAQKPGNFPTDRMTECGDSLPGSTPAAHPAEPLNDA